MNKKRVSDIVSIVFCGALLLLSFYGPRKFFDWSLGLPPTHLLISLLFLPWALCLLTKPSKFVVNKYIVDLGRVSFSAYILHFAVLKYVGSGLKVVWPFGTVGDIS